jgi:hypothetical protein
MSDEKEPDFLGYDGAGGKVDSVSAKKAVAVFSELWGDALFDCGPQDYDFMAKEIVRVFDLVDELEDREDRLDLPEVQRRRNEPTVPLADVKKEPPRPLPSLAHFFAGGTDCVGVLCVGAGDIGTGL